MKRIFLLIALFALIVGAEPWAGSTVTGTSAAVRFVGSRTMVSSLFMEMLPTSGGGHLGYLLYAPPNVTCALNGAGTTTIAVLSPATALLPGGNVTVPSNPDPNGGADLQGYCWYATTGDSVLISWNLRN